MTPRETMMSGNEKVDAIRAMADAAIDRARELVADADLRAETAEAEMKKVREEYEAAAAALVAIRDWARGRQKLADREAEQGGEEFLDIANMCEAVVGDAGNETLAPCGHVWEGKGGTCTKERCAATVYEIKEKCRAKLDMARDFLSSLQGEITTHGHRGSVPMQCIEKLIACWMQRLDREEREKTVSR